MLSNQILHKTAQDIREITGFDCAIWDMQGLCLVRTNENLTEYELQIQDFRDDEEEPDEMILWIWLSSDVFIEYPNAFNAIIKESLSESYR